jgi:HEAT repeat protein
MRLPCRIAIAVLLIACLKVRTADDEMDLGPDEKTLQEAKIGTDGPALVEFIRSRTLSDAERAKLAETVRRLGHNDFDVREKASEDLVKAGRSAEPFLRKAVGDPDAEIDRRARDCLVRIKNGPERGYEFAAVRLLAARRPAEADRVLLDFLPCAADDFLADAIIAAVEVVGVRDGKPTAALKAALDDKEPPRRAAAAQVIALHCPVDRAPVVKLLTDAEPTVRYRAASALARAGEKRAVPVLIGLLADGPQETAWQVEYLLLRLAGDQAPAVALNSADEPARKKCREAWADWWKANEAKADLARLGREESLGLRVVCELQGAKGGGRVVAFGPDDKVRWEIDGVEGPIDFQVLPNGHVLLAEINSRKVTERDRDGKVVFEKQVAESPMTCLRLPNGNTFIATYHEVLEVDRAGKQVYAHQRPGQSIYCALKLRNGNIMTVDAGGQLIELTTEGKEVRRVAAGDTSNWGGFEILPNGHFVVARCGQHQVVEIDPTGKQVWEVKIEWPTWAGRLSNGRTLVACAHSGQVVEFDRAGNRVWEMKLGGRPCRLRRY